MCLGRENTVFVLVSILVRKPWVIWPRSLARLVDQIALLGLRARWRYSNDLPVTQSMTEFASGAGLLAVRSRRIVVVTKQGRVPYVLMYGLRPVAAFSQAEIRWGHHCLTGEGRWRQYWSGYRGVTGRLLSGSIKTAVAPRVISPSVMVAGRPQNRRRQEQRSPSEMVGG